MFKITLSAISASLLAFTISAGSALAQPARVFVAAQGLDNDPCTFALPCRTFQRAHNVVAAKGEIEVLDPAGYGTLTITKAISIQGHGFSGISAPSGNAITINAGPSDKINLRGILIDGVGYGATGIKFNTGASLNVQDCLIRNFAAAGPAGDGIFFAPSGNSKLSVSNTLTAHNSRNGVSFFPTGSGTVTAVFDHVEIDNNGADGLHVFAPNGTDGTFKVTLSNSVVANNGGNGVLAVKGEAPVSIAVLVRNSTIADNVNGLTTSSGIIIRVTHSTITGNRTGLNGIIESFGDNAVRGNTTDGAPTSTIPLQ